MMQSISTLARTSMYMRFKGVSNKKDRINHQFAYIRKPAYASKNNNVCTCIKTSIIFGMIRAKAKHVR